MLFIENIRLALSSLMANKMRSLLTMLGIIIGISSVIAIMTVGNSMTQTLTGQMSSLGANNIEVYVTTKSLEDERTEDGLVFLNADTYAGYSNEDLISDEMIEEYYETYKDSIKAISLQYSVGSGRVGIGKKTARVSATGISKGYMIANDRKLLYGRFFTQNEIEGAKRVCIISDKAAESIFPEGAESAIGKEVTLEAEGESLEFVVVGVYEHVQAAALLAGSGMETEMNIPLTTARELSHRDRFVFFLVVAAPEVDNQAFMNTTRQFFEGYYRTNRTFTVDTYSMSSMVESFTKIFSTVTAAISVIAGIALLVGGIGVMNIMLVSITERTREIGTRKALGAPNSSIRLQFITEAVIICLIGGIIGMILGVFGGEAVAVNFMHAEGHASVSSIVGSLVFSMAIGVFFGYYPANKAAKMDPIEALRYE